MKKLWLLSFFTLVFSGCTFSSSPVKQEWVLRSVDGGMNWEVKSKTDARNNIAGVNVLSMVVNSRDSKIIYLGTEKNGIFFTQDGGENWERIDFPPQKVYGLAIDGNNPDIIYASGVWDKKGKIYRSDNRGFDWKEIYTEPAPGTIILSLATGRHISNLIYFATDQGVISKSEDGGKNWKNLKKANGPIGKIEMDYLDDRKIYFQIFDKGLLFSGDGGETFEDLTDKIVKQAQSNKVFALSADPNQAGTVYVGLQGGLLKSINYGAEWETLNVLESSRNFPIRALAIDPFDSQKIIYSAAGAIYKSEDGGKSWSTFQLDFKKFVSQIIFDPNNHLIIYAGLRD